MERKRVNHVGEKFGRLLVIEDLGRININGKITQHRYVKCLCDCGNTTIVSYNNLSRGKTKSCGCLRKENKWVHDGAGRPKKYNDYYIGEYEGEYIVFVKASNKDEYILVDVDDWDKLKDTCWHIAKTGYAAGIYNDKLTTMQSALIPNVPEGCERDHINRNRVDNRRCNLRIVSKLDNLHNRVYKNKTSIKTGVCWYPLTKQWLAYITNKGEYIRLGLYDNEEDAIAVRKQAEVDIYGKPDECIDEVA